jgi:bifunctional DNA primase/polymerase-like protein
MSNPADPFPGPAAYVTRAGADWLASASPFPRSVRALWALRPQAPSVLPCGHAFDVVSAPVVLGRQLVERLWAAGPGSGPVAVHRGRMLLFAAPGTAQRLPALLGWEEWETAQPDRQRRRRAADGLLCHGMGDEVTVPSLSAEPTRASRWLVAPDVRSPWLPAAGGLLWAWVRAQAVTKGSGAGQSRAEGSGISIFTPARGGAKVYDVSRRR